MVYYNEEKMKLFRSFEWMVSNESKGRSMATSAEANLERLRKTDLAKEFVRSHNGEWNHSDWLAFCRLIEERGFTPIDLDQVGLLLEATKTLFLQGKL